MKKKKKVEIQPRYKPKDADSGDRVVGKWGFIGSQLKLKFNTPIKPTNKRKAAEMEDSHEEPESGVLEDAILAALSEDEDEYEVKESAERLGYDVAKRLPQLERLLPKSAPHSPSASIQVKGTSDSRVPPQPATKLANTYRTHVADSFGPEYDTPPLGQGTRKTIPSQTRSTQTLFPNGDTEENDLELLAAIPSSELNQITSSPSFPSTWGGISSLPSSPPKDVVAETDFLDDEDTAWMDAMEPEDLSLLEDLLRQLSQKSMPSAPSRSTAPRKGTGAGLISSSPAAQIQTPTPAPISFTFGSQWICTQELLAMEQEAQ